jgi:hypothetical protein
MDLKSINKFGRFAIEQYCPPLNFELAGKAFAFAMDDGHDHSLNFIDEKALEWNDDNDQPVLAYYKCLKADDTTYLVNYELENVTPRVCHTFVIDMDNMLVTRVIARIGLNPKYPYLINTEFTFGAIRQDGKELTFKRHGYTSDMIGNVVQWNYGSDMSTVHVYYCANYYRITAPPDRSKEAAEADWAFKELMSALPSSDEPAVYIRIKEGIYLFSLIEQNMEKLTNGRFQFRSNTLCFLQNYERVYQVGRAFGTSTTERGDINTNIMIGAVGKHTEVDPRFLTDPNPYLT